MSTTTVEPPPLPIGDSPVEHAATMSQTPMSEKAEQDGNAKIIENEGAASAKSKQASNDGLKNYFRVFAYGTRLDYLLLLLCIITSIGSGVAFPLMTVVFGQLVGTFTDYFTPGTSVTASEFQDEINNLTLYLVYLFIAKFVLSYISMLTVRISGLRISAALRLAYLRALFRQPVSVIDTISPGKVSTRITTSSNTVQIAISQQFAMMFQSFAFVIGAYIIAFIENPLLTLVASASLPFILILMGVIIPPFTRINKITEKYSEDASAMAFEVFSSIRMVVAFGAEDKLARQHEELLTKGTNNFKKAAPIS